MHKAALLLAALLLSAPAVAQDWRGPAAIEVQVEDAKGRNLGGAEILLVYLSPDGGGQLPSVLTGADGHAQIGGLAAGRWSIEVRHAGHMSYRAELALGADSKPSVQSASHLMAPGATSTMKVKFSRGRGGASVAPRAAAAPPAAPAPPAERPEESAPAPVMTQAPAKAPVREAAPAVAVAPTPAPVAAPAPERAPVREAPPAVAVAPVAPPVAAPAPEKAPVKVVPPAPAVAPPPAPVVTPAPAPAPPKPPVKEAAPAPAVAPVTSPAPVAVPPPAPAPAPVTPPVAAAPVPAPAPAQAAAVAPRARLCVECPPGESAVWGETAIAGGASAGCPADLPGRLKSVELTAVGALSAELGAGCRVITVELPAGARFTGFRYEAQSAGLSADCLPGRGCPAGDCRFPNEPVLRQEGNRTVLLVPFESTAAEQRRAVVAGYSTYNKR